MNLHSLVLQYPEGYLEAVAAKEKEKENKNDDDDVEETPTKGKRKRKSQTSKWKRPDLIKTEPKNQSGFVCNVFAFLDHSGREELSGQKHA